MISYDVLSLDKIQRKQDNNFNESKCVQHDVLKRKAKVSKRNQVCLCVYRLYTPSTYISMRVQPIFYMKTYVFFVYV